MNRENKRKQYEKGYYKTHPCSDTFTCKVCGWLVTPEGASSNHRNHCPNCLSSLHVDIEPGDRESDCGGVMEPVAVWVRKGICGVSRYTRVLMPSFLFLIGADIFMLLSALFHGTLPHKLFRKQP